LSSHVVPNSPKRDVVIFSMLAEEFADSPANTMSAGVVAFDAAGRKLT